jgi:hypothetical protein
MPIKMPSAAEIADRYKKSIGSVPDAYKKGIESTTNWRDAAIGGQSLFEQKMQDPAVLARRKKGLEAVTDAEWKKAAAETGSTRIGAGMTAGADKRTKAYEPYRAALAAIDLPARTADPMQNVTNRVGKIAVTLAELKKKA